MPIKLFPPAHDPKGPYGGGWNRLSIGSLAGVECALQPRTEAAFWEAMDTRRAGYGPYDACVCPDKDGCQGCPYFEGHTTWPLVVEVFHVRPDWDGRPWIMNRLDRGWGEYGEPTTWKFLYRLNAIVERGHDKHGGWIQFTKALAGGEE